MTDTPYPLTPEPLRDAPHASPPPPGEGADEIAFPIVTNSMTTMPALVVNVDFNSLLLDQGEAEALRIVGILKDLLQVHE